MIGLFIVLSVAADLISPAKNYYFIVERVVPEIFQRMESLDLRSPLPHDWGAIGAFLSLPYLILLRAANFLVPDRLAAMRLVSVLSGSAVLAFFYLLGKKLVSRSAAIVAVFFLVANPAFLETARSFGFISFSHMAALLAVLLAVVAGEKERWGIWVALSAAASYLLLHVYSLMRITTIPLIIAFFLISGRDRWRKLLLFTVVFIVLLAGFGLFQDGGPGLVSAVLQTREWSEFAGGPIEEAGLRNFLSNLERNTPILAGYLFNLDRTVFTTGTALTPTAEQSRLFHSAFIPFWMLGLAVCAFRRRRGDLMVLLMLAVFILPKLPSNGLWPRRMLDMLYPLALLVGVAFVYLYSLLSRALSGKAWQAAVPAAAGGFLLLVGFLEAGHFLLELSRPSIAMSRRELSRLADHVGERLQRDEMVISTRAAHPYLFGNRYLINRLKGDHVFLSIPPRYGRLVGYLENALVVGRPLSVIYVPPRPEEFSSCLDWANEHFPGALTFFELPGGHLNAFTFTPPADLSPNLVISERPRVIVSGEASPYSDFLDDEGFFHLAARPPSPEEAPSIVFDFGEDNRRVPRVILASPPGRITPRPDLFIRRAVVSAGFDGEEWEEVGRLRGDRVSRHRFFAYQWTFAGDRPFRYYRFEFFDDAGRPAAEVVLQDLGLFETENHLANLLRREEIVFCDD